MKVRNRYLLVMAVVWGPCLLAAATCYAVLLRPQRECRKELEARLAGSKKEYAWALQVAKEKNQDHLAEQVEGLNHRIGDFVLSPAQAQNLAFHIGALANESKLESFGMRPATRNGTEGRSNLDHVGERRVDLAFSAGFQHFVAFLNALERRRPAVFVETFTISRPTEKGTEPQASMELAVLVEKTAGSTGESK